MEIDFKIIFLHIHMINDIFWAGCSEQKAPRLQELNFICMYLSANGGPEQIKVTKTRLVLELN